jgi:SNF2 family DNA or RNA helicase
MITRFTSNEKVLVWERSPQIIHDLHAYYQNKGIGSIYIDGTVDKMERESIIKRFNEDPSIKIFIVSFLATAESWEIPSRKDCRRMIFYSLPDRIINYSQATDRLHRISSEEDVYVYRLILKDSLDEWAAALLDYKQKIKDGMMDRLDFKKIEMASFIKHMGLDKKQIIVR